MSDDEIYIDACGTVWHRPTAWTHRAVCIARDKWQQRAAAAEEEVKQLQDKLKQWEEI